MEEAAIRPHKSKYWLNPRIDDPEQHAKQVEAVCDVYRQAAELEAARIHVVSCDEKTGIQALERAAPTKPTRPGLDERREFEYRRHGTLCLTANFVVATGKILEPTIGPTRNEQDFARHVERTIATDPQAGWIFVMDNLTTHCSESLVRLIARLQGMNTDLGTKGKNGILANVKSRRVFLCDEAHRIRFVFTPKHCSWLNQVEIWFSILSRRALKRASFKSTDELRAALLAFIEYFNALLAKPFRWTYTGKVLAT